MKQIDWERQYRKNAAQLKGVCRRYIGNSEIAEDLVQETFITAMDKFNTFKGLGSIDSWIRKIAINKALLYIRENKHADILTENIEHQVEQETEMEQSSNNIRFTIENASFSNDELLSVVDNLPENYKIVFNMYVIDGYSHKQIANLLSISSGTSKSLLSRARKKSQDMLYSKAIEKQTTSERRKGSLFLLLLQPNYIDEIFKRRLKGYEIAVTSLQSPISSVPVTPLRWGATLAGKAIIAGISVTALTGSIYLTQINNNENHSSSPEKIESYIIPDTLDSHLTNSPITDTIKTKDSVINKTTEKSKVIIKKTIVIHDTICLEKTVSK